MGNLNRIKAVLADVGKKGIWLAEKLGKDPVTISKWCTNTTQPDLQTLFKIAELLEVNVSDLIVDKDRRNPSSESINKSINSNG